MWWQYKQKAGGILRRRRRRGMTQGSKKASWRMCGLNRQDAHSRAQCRGRALTWKELRAWENAWLSRKAQRGRVWSLCLQVISVCGKNEPWAPALKNIRSRKGFRPHQWLTDFFLRTQKPLFKWDVTQKCRARKHMEDHCSDGRPSPGPLAFPEESQEIRQSLQGLQNTTVRLRWKRWGSQR